MFVRKNHLLCISKFYEMKETNASLQDIKAIRQMMEDSSKFLSLSGLSGVAAGAIALLGSAYAYFFILGKGSLKYDEYMNGLGETNTTQVRLGLLFIALIVLIAALSAAWFLSYRKSQKSGLPFWNHTAKKLTWNLASVLIVGGLFCLILIYQQNISMVASAMLVFYGLALLMASRYTHKDIQYLGYTEIILGLIAGLFLNYGLLFWSIGFGFFHIAYGIAMYIKYDR